MTKPYQLAHLGVTTDYDYTATHKRERLSLWSGPFSSVREGEAYSLPRGDGYMITLEYGGKIRVTCPAPRTDENYLEIDEALRVAVNAYFLATHAMTLAPEVTSA
jgi:hypothetical protein